MTPIQPNTTFHATPRPHQWSNADYLTLAAKVVFFPITGLYYAIRYCFSCIAYSCGITGSDRPEIDEQKRRVLVRAYGGAPIEFITEDGVKLEGMYLQNIQAKPNAKTILICAGSRESYEANTIPMVNALYRMGHNVMLFNYRGFGNSKGTASEQGFYLDAEAAYQYLKSVKGLTDEQIVAMGYSMGSAPATDLAAHHRIPLFLDRYFSSMSDVAYDKGCDCISNAYGLLAKITFYFGDADFDLKEKIKAVEGRIFLARGDTDHIMRSYHEKHFKKSLSGRTNVEFMTVDSGHLHSDEHDSLWFHPTNQWNGARQERLALFLNA